MSDYSEHLISMAGGDGETFDNIQRRIADCLTYNFDRRTAAADKLAHEDAPYLLALAKDQQNKLDRIIELAHWAGKRGWTIHPAEIRTALEAS